MGVRQKLNQGYAQGVLAIAGLLGILSGSGEVFWIAAVIMLALSVHAGEIRLRAKPRRDDRRSPPDRHSGHDGR